MVHYLIEHIDWIFVKGYKFLSFAKNIYKKIGENISKYSPGMLAARQNLDHENSLLQMHLKLLPKEQFKKQQKQLGTKIENKFTKDSQQKVIEIPRNANRY